MTGTQMVATLGHTKRAVMMGLVSVLILAFIFALSRTPNPVPATYSPASALVATPAPVPSWSYTVPAQIRAKIPHVAKSSPAAKPAPVPAVAAVIQPEPVPAAVAKEAVVPAAESTGTAISKPAEVAAPAVASKNAVDSIPEPAPVAAPENTHEPAPAAASENALVAITEPSSVPALKIFPAATTSPTQAAPSNPISPTDAMVDGTTAALVLAPFMAPVAIVVGLVVGIMTPTASQLGQVPTAPKPKAGTVTHTAPSSDSVY